MLDKKNLKNYLFTFYENLSSSKSQLLIILVIIIASLTAAYIFGKKPQNYFLSFGYIGIFIISFLSTIIVFFPAPSILIIITMIIASGNLFLASIVAALGAAIGEFSGYLIGSSAKHIVDKISKADMLFGKNQFKRWFVKWEFVMIFLFSLIPNPLMDIVGILAGYLKLDAKKFLVAVAIGKFLQYVVLSIVTLKGISFFLGLII